MNIKNTDKLEFLQKQKKDILKKISDLDNIFKEEKDNEESWPGHSSTRYQTADIDRQVLMEQLESIEKAIEELSKS